MTNYNSSIRGVNLAKQCGFFVALSGLNLTAEGSKCVAFLGPHGAGKTTTLKIFTDLIGASRVEAFICGANVHTQKNALTDVATVIETLGVYPSTGQTNAFISKKSAFLVS